MCGAQHSMCIYVYHIYIYVYIVFLLLGEDKSGQYDRARQGDERLTHAVTLENPGITRGCSRPPWTHGVSE